MPSAVRAATTFDVTVAPVNVAPSFTKGTDQMVLEDCGLQTVSGWATSMSAGPADEAGQTLDFVVTNDNNALFSVQPAIAANGTLTYMPAANGNGMATVTVSLHDNGGTADGGVNTSTPQTFTITVNPVNDAPQGIPDTYGTAEDSVLSVPAPGVLANDIDVDGPSLQAIFGTNPSHGVLVLSGDGSFRYTPKGDYNGADSFLYYVWDGTLESHAVLVNLTVTPVNDAPSFTKGADQTVLEDCGRQTAPGWATAMNVGPANESPQVLTFTITNNTDTALFSVQPVVAANGTLTFTPAVAANGTATLTLTLTDDATRGGAALTTAPQTFTITVTPVNDIPSFTKGTDETVLEDCGPKTVAGWATNVSAGPSNESGQTLNFNVTNSNNSLFAVQPAVAANGTLTYTPAANQNGMVTVTLTLTDDATAGGPVLTTASQTFTITVGPVNDPPVNTILPSMAGAMNVGDMLTAAPGTWNDTIDLAVSGTSTLTYAYQWVRADDASGMNAVDIASATSSTYVLSDPDAHKYMCVRVTCTDDGVGLPTAQSAVFPTPWTSQVINRFPSITEGASTPVSMDEDAHPTSFSLTLHATDADSDTLTWSIAAQTLHGTAVATGTGTSKAITYIPTADYNGSDSFVVQVSDGYGGTVGITVTVTVNPINNMPSFTGGADQTVLEDCGPETVSGWATFISTGPENESVQAFDFVVDNNNHALFSVQPTVAANGTLTFTPAADASGTAIVTVLLHDDGGRANGGVDTSAPQMFTITVTAVNDPPANTCTLTYTAGANGTISGTSPQTVNQGASGTTVTATPTVGYHFVSWSDGSLTAARTDTNVTVNVNVSASFAINTYTIVASAGANGGISPSGNVMVNHGASQSFSITPSTGYHIQNVLVDGSSVGAVTSYTFTNLTENHTIAASFAIDTYTDTYTLTYTAGANGTISGTSPQTVNQGASGTTVTATPYAGHHFVSWSDGSLTAARTDTNVTVNVNVSASFAINTYALTVSMFGSGSVAKNPDQSSYAHGTSVQLTATPASRWHFVGWSGGLSGTTNPTTITMEASKTVTATYASPVPRPVSGHTMVLTIGSKTMTVDGARVALDAPAALVEDRTLVPLRAVVEHLGGSIAWNPRTRQVTLKARGTTIILTIGKSTALVNGKSLAIDPKNSKVAPLISSGRTMLPLRFVAENLGLQVRWNAETRTITVAWDD